MCALSRSTTTVGGATCIWSAPTAPRRASTTSSPRSEGHGVIKGRMKTPWLAFLCLAVFAARAHAQAPQTYSNVFDYCTAIGAIDQFDARFTGVLPESKAANLFKIEPGALHEGAFAWRCMNRAVWVCAQLNSPICGKTDISRAPTPAMSEYCK